jgi:hypothetical protein
MQVKVCTRDSYVEAYTEEANMVALGFVIVVHAQQADVSVFCNNLVNGSTASGVDSWVVIGKKP